MKIKHILHKGFMKNLRNRMFTSLHVVMTHEYKRIQSFQLLFLLPTKLFYSLNDNIASKSYFRTMKMNEVDFGNVYIFFHF